MNTHLRSVKLTLKGKPTVSLDQMSVRGSNIRWVESSSQALACPALSPWPHVP